MVTPTEEFERFAERLYNYAAGSGKTIQSKLDFDTAFDNYMEGAKGTSSVLRDNSWNIIQKEFNITDNLTEKQKKEQEKRKGKGLGGKVKVQRIKEPPKEDYLAKIWNKKTNHYQVTTVRGVTDKNGKMFYWKGSKKVKVFKVQRLKK